MFAVVSVSGKQLKVKEGEVVYVNKLPLNKGEKLTVSQVLMCSNEDGTDVKVGTPVLQNASVEFEVIEHARDKKVIIFKKKRRNNYRRKNGHRQDLTAVKVVAVKVS